MIIARQDVRPRLWGAVLLSAAVHAAAMAGAGSLAGSTAPTAATPSGLTVRLAGAAPAERIEVPPATPSRRERAGSGPAMGSMQKPLALPEPRYFRASELDSRPAPLGEIEPAMPQDAGAKAGRVIARILINAAGVADRVIIESAEPPQVFDRTVVDAFSTARYRPGMKGGAAVGSQMRVEVSFQGD